MGTPTQIPQTTPQLQQVAPAQPQDSTQAAPAAQPDDSTQTDSNLPEEDAGAPVKIHRAFSKMNSAIRELFDGGAVRRSFSVPYVDGGAMHDHIAAVGAAASQTGGFTNNLLFTYHHPTGKGWGSGDGETIGYPATKLKDTLIPKDDVNAIKAIAATKSLVNQIASLIGDDDKSIQVSKSQLSLVSKHGAEGMTLLDLGVALQNIVVAPLKALARAHSEHKHGGIHPKLTAPKAR
jgi:hypothetical protein